MNCDSSAWRMVCSPMLLIPAYGRTYATVEAMRKDWEAGKDFSAYGQGGYCSIRDVHALRANASSVTLTDPRTHVSLKVD